MPSILLTAALTSIPALADEPLMTCEIEDERVVERWNGIPKETLQELDQLIQFLVVTEATRAMELVAETRPHTQSATCCSDCPYSDVECQWHCSNDWPCDDTTICDNDIDCVQNITHCVAGVCVPLPGCPCGTKLSPAGEAVCDPCGGSIWEWLTTSDYTYDFPWWDPVDPPDGTDPVSPPGCGGPPRPACARGGHGKPVVRGSGWGLIEDPTGSSGRRGAGP